MEDENALAEIRGHIEALRSTQIALLVALGSQADLDLAGIARSARSWGMKANLQGPGLQAMNTYMDTLDALGQLPRY